MNEPMLAEVSALSDLQLAVAQRDEAALAALYDALRSDAGDGGGVGVVADAARGAAMNAPEAHREHVTLRRDAGAWREAAMGARVRSLWTGPAARAELWRLDGGSCWSWAEACTAPRACSSATTT
jgi:hypothetical protein